MEPLPIIATALLVVLIGWLGLVVGFRYMVSHDFDFTVHSMPPSAWREPGASRRATERGLELQRRALRRLMSVWPLMVIVFAATVVLFLIAGMKGQVGG